VEDDLIEVFAGKGPKSGLIWPINAKNDALKLDYNAFRDPSAFLSGFFIPSDL
jgi:hypothetical protein